MVITSPSFCLATDGDMRVGKYDNTVDYFR